MPALGSVWDSLGMGLVGKGYLRSWDSSQSRLWTPVKPVQPSLSDGSTSTTVVAAMFADKRLLAASVLLAMSQPGTGLSCVLRSNIRCDISHSPLLHRQKKSARSRLKAALSSNGACRCLLTVLTAREHTTCTKTVRKRFNIDMTRFFWTVTSSGPEVYLLYWFVLTTRGQDCLCILKLDENEWT